MTVHFSPLGLQPRQRWFEARSWRGELPAEPTPSRSMRSSLRDWRRRAYERRLLAGLTERERRDLALTPADVARECAKPFWRA